DGTGVSITSSVAGLATLTASGTTTQTFAGVISNGSGTLAITKTGAGAQILAGTNTYTGGTTLTAGTLILGNNRALGSGSITVNNPTTNDVTAILSSDSFGRAPTTNGTTPVDLVYN